MLGDLIGLPDDLLVAVATVIGYIVAKIKLKRKK
jgi:hypothetical protein